MSVKNLKNEADKILSGLTTREKYQMFEIVLAQMGKRQSDQKTAELKAMYDAIIHSRDTDKTTLRSLERGHQNSMSDSIKRGDLTGNARKNKKQA